MKGGRTRLAHKAEQAVDLETGAIVATTTHPGVTSGTVTVSEDGLLVTADAGSGIRRGGWQCAGENLERPFAHQLETAAMRRWYVRGLDDSTRSCCYRRRRAT